MDGVEAAVEAFQRIVRRGGMARRWNHEKRCRGERARRLFQGRTTRSHMAGLASARTQSIAPDKFATHTVKSRRGQAGATIPCPPAPFRRTAGWRPESTLRESVHLESGQVAGRPPPANTLASLPPSISGETSWRFRSSFPPSVRRFCRGPALDPRRGCPPDRGGGGPGAGRAAAPSRTGSTPACSKPCATPSRPGGKRLRPFLVLETAAPVRRAQGPAMRVACAIECLHTYSLVHDDLPAMDDDDLRRGRPTTHKAFDEATAILAGDALLTIAFEILADEATHRTARCARPW
ncbi:MAG: polyprenyl synthetase family protein [Caulobacteraceae bacterium]